MDKIKVLLKKLANSSFKISDGWSLIISCLFFKKDIWVSSSFKVSNKGRIHTDGPAYLGVFSNKLGLNRAAKGQVIIGENGVLKLGSNVRVARGCNLFVNKQLSIGSNTYLQANGQILANNGVSIGANCALSWNLQILDDDLHTLRIDGEAKVSAAPITIGNKVWIGCNCTILKGTVIGDNCVVAAGSVVKGDFPANSLIGGVPAKVIKTNVSWS